MGGVEADYVAFAFGGGCAEEEGGFVCRALVGSVIWGEFG